MPALWHRSEGIIYLAQLQHTVGLTEETPWWPQWNLPGLLLPASL